MDFGHQLKRIEMKFILGASQSSDIKVWAREHLGVDENCNTEGGDAYAINTLYLDTPRLDLFHRTGVIGQTKHRIRRYGTEETLWLETKRKKNMVVRKNRTAVFESDLMPRLSGIGRVREHQSSEPVCHTSGNDDSIPLSSQIDKWPADWFIDRITQRQLRPAIQVNYRRFARTTTIDGQNLRLTIDSDMIALPIQGWHVTKGTSHEERPTNALTNSEVLELKFNDTMPLLFKELLRSFPLPVAAFSKYRTALTAAGTGDNPAESTGTLGHHEAVVCGDSTNA